jgi:peptidyl-prolyl cis-trans isomerase C
MRRPVPPPALVVHALVVCASILSAAAAAAGRSSDPVLATVNGEPVTLSRVRGGMGDAPSAGEAGKALDRMIGVELATQEGYRMGLEHTLEVRDQMGIIERDTLRDGLFAGRVGGLKPDPNQVESMAKAMTVEVRIRSAMFNAEADAGRLADRAAHGDDFDAAAKEIAANGKGSVDPGEGFIRMSDLLPAVQAAIAPLTPGRVSAVYKIGEKFAVSRLVERRPAPDPDARAKAEAEMFRRMQADAIAKYAEELKKKYARVNESLYATLDFQADKPGFESYLKDERTLVTIAGAEPITVHVLADAVRKRLFHGAGRAAEKNRLNRKRDEVLEDLIAKRVVMREAIAQGLDKKPEYLALRAEEERKLVFGAFVAKVIEPDVKVTDAEIGKYYEAHRTDLTGPDMARLESIAFGSRKEAEAALAKLRAGADPVWMRTNAPGRLDPEANPDLLTFPSAPVTLGDLPADLRQSLTSAASGEYRLYSATGGATYVILVRELLPGQTMPRESASGRIRAKLTGEKRQKAFDDYVATLRKASQVKILVTPAQLDKLVASPSPS